MKEDWIECELGELLKLKNGYAFQASNYIKDGIPVFRIGDINDWDVSAKNAVAIAEDSVYDNFIVKKGDILIAMSGATTGKFGIYNSDEKAYQNQRVGNLKLFSENAINKSFVFYLLYSLKRDIEREAYGGAQPNISGEKIEALKTKLAPLPIQRAIVSKIEALFSDLDNGIANFKKAQAQLKIYRQAVLKKAFEGELTKEWREDYVKTDGRLSQPASQLPTAEELLQQIKEERQNHYNQQMEDWKKAVKEWEKNGKVEKKPSKPTPLKELITLKEEELGELPSLPKGWAWIKLGLLSEKIQIGPFGTQLHKHDYISDGVPIINPKHIKYQKITPDIFISNEKAISLSQYLLKSNDVILGRRGEMGRTALITEKQNNWICGTGSLFIRFSKNFVGKFYSLILSERRVVNYLNTEGSGTTMTNLNNSIINDLPIQIVSLPEQTQIVAEIERRLSVCDKVEQSITESLAKAEALRQSILKKAFEGQLLSQAEIAECKKEADYEPASVLLARIKQSRKEKIQAEKVKTDGHPSQPSTKKKSKK